MMQSGLRSFTAVALLFLVLPILVIVPLSFSSGTLLSLPIPGVSWRWYQDFFASERWMLATRNSFVVGAATAALATALGTSAAIGLYLGRFRAQAALLAVLSAPIVTPSVIIGVAMYFAFARVGLNSTLPGLVLAHTVLALPYVVISVLAALSTIDRVLLRAAASLGAAPLTVFARVLLPLAGPGIATGALFAFAISFDELVLALFIAGPEQYTLPRQMLAGIREFLSPTICAAAVVLSAVSLALLAASRLVARPTPGA